MKFDKDLLLKHRFWVGLAVALPLTLVGIALLLTSVSAQIAKERGTIEGNLKKIKNPPGEVVNEKGIGEADERAKTAQGKQDLVWENAYKPQTHLYTWPEKIETEFEFQDGCFANEVSISKEAKDPKEWPADKKGQLVHGKVKDVLPEYFTIADRAGTPLKVHRTARTKIRAEEGGDLDYNRLAGHRGKLVTITYQRGKYFNDPLTSTELYKYAHAYKDQLYPVLEQVDPMGFDSEGQPTGVVQLKGMPYDPSRDLTTMGPFPFFRYVNKLWDSGRDFSEEAWLAQEDIWVQRDIYALIRKANDMVSKLDKVQAARPGYETFTNPYLTLELKVAGDELQAQITNRLKRRQRLDQAFLIKFREKGPAERVKLTGNLVTGNLEPLEPAGTRDASGKPLDAREIRVKLDPGPSRTGIVSVEQALTWETAAVRRIDDVAFAEPRALSHRNFGATLRGYTAAPEGSAGPTALPGNAPPGSMPSGPMPSGPRGAYAGKAGFGPGPGAGAALGNLPHGLWKERYLDVTPQARRIPVAVALIVDQDHVDRVLTAFNNSPLRFLTTQWILNHYPQSLRPQFNGATVAAAGPGGGFPMGPGGFPMGPGGFPMGPGGAGQEAAQDLEANMELVIYGVVTLYERFPPRPAGAGGPAPSVAPPVGTPPGAPLPK